MSRHSLDVRWLLCPLPMIRTQETIGQLADGDELQIIATDPGGPARYTDLVPRTWP